MTNTVTVNQLADARGWDQAKIRRILKREGVKVVNGKCDGELAAKALTTKGDTATADEKRFLECQLLKIDIDKARGALVEVESIVQQVTRRDAELAGRIRTWKETLTAKHPKHWQLFDQAFTDLCAMLSEPVELK